MALVFPSANIHEVLVVALGLAVLGLVLDTEVAAAGLFAVGGVSDDELCQLEVVFEAVGFLQLGVELFGAARDVDLVPELCFELFDELAGGGEAFGAACHAAVFPHDAAEGLVEMIDGVELLGVGLDAEEAVDALAHGFFSGVELGGLVGDLADVDLVGEVVLDGVGEDEVAIGEALHQCGGTEAVGAVVGEVGFASGKEAGDGGLELVIDPEAAHGVVDSGVDAHGLFVGVDVGDLLVHLEEVAVAGFDDVAAEALDGVGEVEIDSQTGAYAIAGIAALFGGAGGDVARHEVAEGGIAALEVVVAVFLSDVVGAELVGADGLGVFFLLGHPDAAVVAEALAHEGELGLVVAVDGDAGGVDLDVAGVGEGGAMAMADPGGAAVGVHGVGGEVIDIAVAAGAEDDAVGCVAFELAADEVADDDAAGAVHAVFVFDEDEVHHLTAFVETDAAASDFAAEGAVGTEEELLTGLTAGVEGSADLRTAEGAVVEVAAIVACERHTLSDALVDDVVGYLGKAIHVGFAAAVVSSLDGIIEQTVDGVVVVLVVLCGVDTSLCGD